MIKTSFKIISRTDSFLNIYFSLVGPAKIYLYTQNIERMLLKEKHILEEILATLKNTNEKQKLSEEE